MRRSILALSAVLAGAAVIPAQAAEVTETELMQAATDLSRQYDANYADKNAAAMAALYAPDGVLVSPSGSIIRGREALKAYYVKRFAAGARGHAIKVSEVHVQGDGGYGLAQFSVISPGADGAPHETHGAILAVYRRDPDGWRFRIVEPSVPETAGR
jgi:uncharacterized protein (TIGR02246 family)